jgi:phosphoglycolate phosphatase
LRLRDVLLRLSSPGGIAHVAFDLDGTLVDSRADLAAAVNHVLAARGRPPIDPPTVYGYVGDGARALIERAFGPLPAAELEAALALFLDHYGAHCLDETRLYAGLDGALAALRAAGRTLSVVTNKPCALAEQILAGLGVRGAFVDVVGGDSLPTRKPDPAGLQRVAERAGVPIGRTMLVGDSPIDLDTASAAGAVFCGVAWGLAPQRLLARRPRRLARDPYHLVALVDAVDSPAERR